MTSAAAPIVRPFHVVLARPICAAALSIVSEGLPAGLPSPRSSALSAPCGETLPPWSPLPLSGVPLFMHAQHAQPPSSAPLAAAFDRACAAPGPKIASCKARPPSPSPVARFATSERNGASTLATI
ncbi:hypothetical protein AB5I41_20210 [Sphingomonas sp. MMS24-JH45]